MEYVVVSDTSVFAVNRGKSILRWMKSLRDEIRLAAQERTDLISYIKWILLYYEDWVIAVAESKLADLFTYFTVNILKLTNRIKGHYFLIILLERNAIFYHLRTGYYHFSLNKPHLSIKADEVF
ncbi:MAG: hypothetical protein ACI4II_05480 [Acutalibacteraceae bacterium]